MPTLFLSIGIIQLLTMLVGLVRAKALSVVLGPAGFGVVGMIDQVVLTVAHLAAISLPFTAMKFMARSHSEGGESFQRTCMAFLRALAVLAAIAVAIVSALLLWQPAVFGGELLPYRGLLILAVLGVPIFLLNILFANTLAAAQLPVPSAALTLLTGLALALAAIVGVVLGGIAGMYAAGAIAGAAGILVTWRYLRRRLAWHAGAQPADLLGELRSNPEIVRFALYFYVAMAAYALAMYAVRYVVFSRLGETEAGLLQAMISVALAQGAVLGTINNLYLTPLVNRHMPTDAKVAAANDFAGMMLVILLLAALPVVLYPRLVLTLLFSGSFEPAARVLFLFILWQCLFQIANIFHQLLIGLDDVRFYALLTAASYAGAVLLLPGLTASLGLEGAALALIGGVAASGLAAALRLRLRFGIAIHGSVWLRCLLCLTVLTAAGRLFSAAGEWTMAGSGERMLFALAVVVLTWLLLTPEERSRLGNLRRRA